MGGSTGSGTLDTNSWFNADNAWLDAADVYATLEWGDTALTPAYRNIELPRGVASRITEWTAGFSARWKNSKLADAQGRKHNMAVAIRVAAMLTNILDGPTATWETIRGVFGWPMAGIVLALYRRPSRPLDVHILDLRNAGQEFEVCLLKLAETATKATLRHTDIEYLKTWLPDEAAVIMTGLEPVLKDLAPYNTTKEYLELLRKRTLQPVTSKPSDIVVPTPKVPSTEKAMPTEELLGSCVD